ncbi:MAG: serine hydrolase [Bacteriovoracaceae bacterium]|nr:serine hydrolase [Bacteriovoracaceae bacterium]
MKKKQLSNLGELASKLMNKQHFDCLAVASIDFKKNTYQSYATHDALFFDLASLTKPLTIGAISFLHPKLFDESMLLLLNHRAGLPPWGRLSRDSWQKQINSYEIKASKSCCYSDFSALRLMLELEKKSKKKLVEMCSSYWDELYYWQDLPPNARCAPSGFRNHKVICGEVHDDNAFVIKENCSHAGLFATIDGLSKSLINLNKSHQLLAYMQTQFKKAGPNHPRFISGWDTVLDQSKTLAGKGVSPNTFGHLGFTGTSIWIDIEKNLGTIILTNATKNYWYDRDGLNLLRRELGSFVFNN